jgi:hypothetical protein
MPDPAGSRGKGGRLPEGLASHAVVERRAMHLVDTVQELLTRLFGGERDGVHRTERAEFRRTLLYMALDKLVSQGIVTVTPRKVLAAIPAVQAVASQSPQMEARVVLLIRRELKRFERERRWPEYLAASERSKLPTDAELKADLRRLRALRPAQTVRKTGLSRPPQLRRLSRRPNTSARDKARGG